MTQNRQMPLKILIGDFSPFNSFLKLSPHHYAELLAQEAQVLYLSHPSFILMPLISRIIRSKKEIQEKNGQQSNIPPNLKSVKAYTLFPPIIPISPKYFINNTGNIWQPKWLIRAGFKCSYPSTGRILKQTGFDNIDILMIEDFHVWPLLDMVKARLKIYHMRDDFSGYALWHDHSESIERDVIRKVDKVIVTAKNLERKAQAMGAKEIYYLPNGVDFSHFADVSNLGIPEDLKPISSPRIIYVGAISEWFDTRLIEYCAQELPQCSFILIGPGSITQPTLTGYKNIHILGVKSYDSLPGYLKNGAVGIIPFKKTKLTDSVCPIKLFEYMATGLPVVCTDLTEVRGMSTPAYLAKDKYEFVSKIRQALGIDEKTKETIKEFARQNTWENRFDQLKIALNIENAANK